VPVRACDGVIVRTTLLPDRRYSSTPV